MALPDNHPADNGKTATSDRFHGLRVSHEARLTADFDQITLRLAGNHISLAKANGLRRAALARYEKLPEMQRPSLRASTLLEAAPPGFYTHIDTFSLMAEAGNPTAPEARAILNGLGYSDDEIAENVKAAREEYINYLKQYTDGLEEEVTIMPHKETIRRPRSIPRPAPPATPKPEKPQSALPINDLTPADPRLIKKVTDAARDFFDLPPHIFDINTRNVSKADGFIAESVAKIASITNLKERGFAAASHYIKILCSALSMDKFSELEKTFIAKDIAEMEKQLKDFKAGKPRPAFGQEEDTTEDLMIPSVPSSREGRRRG